MPNPILDQERVEHLRVRALTLKKKALLPAWPRAYKELPIVELEVDWVRFSTLNHRTKAEQMRAIHETQRRDLFTADPLGNRAQEAQYKILCAQDGFDELKVDLNERKQQDPAVITAEGVLINGNRRAAALRSLYRDDKSPGARYLRCLLLPEDATANELVDVEAELQIARDFKQDYSWVNEAMLIEELYERESRDFDLVARRMHNDTNSVRGLYEKLQQLHQLVALSNGTKLHVEFNNRESAFDELAKHIRNKPKLEQDSVRAAYFLGTLAGVNYRTLRHLRRSDAADLVLKEMGNSKALKPLLTTVAAAGKPAKSDDPLDALLGTPGSSARGSKGAELMGVLGFLATRDPKHNVSLAGGGTALVQDLQDTIQTAVEAAAGEAEEDAKETGAVSAPKDRLNEAIAKLERVVATLPKARTFPEWDEADFQSAVATLKAILPKFDPPTKR